MGNRTEEHILKLRDLFNGPLKQAVRTTNQLRKNVGTLNKSFNVLGRTVTVAVAAFAARRAITGLIDIGSQFEQINVRLETFTGSAEKGKEVMKSFTDFAAKTPFQLTGVAQAGGQLLAAGAAVNELIPTLSALGDVAAGTGTPLERIILNFNQVRTQGKLTGRELRDFAVGQIPILRTLADMFGVTTAKVQEMVSKGQVGFGNVQAAFAKMTSEGGIFFNLMQKQSLTTQGQISNLKDVFDVLVNDVFQQLKPQIDAIVVRFGNMVEWGRKNISTIITVIKVVKTLIKAFIGFKVAMFIMKGVRVAMIALKVASIGLRFGLTGITRALRAMSVAFATNPIGLIAGLIGALAATFIDLSGSVDDSTDSINGFNTALSQTQKLKDLLVGITSGFIDPNTGELLIAAGGLGGLKQQAKGLGQSELTEIKQILDDKLSNLSRELINLPKSDSLIRTETNRLISETSSFLKVIKKELGKFPGLGTSTPDGPGNKGKNKLGAGLAEVRSGAPKIFNINIEKQIEQLIFKTENNTESKMVLKEQLRSLLLEVINDVQIMGGG